MAMKVWLKENKVLPEFLYKIFNSASIYNIFVSCSAHFSRTEHKPAHTATFASSFILTAEIFF